jgi:hypothetical protein
MLLPTFPLTANFYLPSEDAPELSAEAVAELIRQHYPHAIVDWERGRQKMADDLQRLIDMGCPEIIYRGQKSLLDKTIFVKIAVEGTHSCLSGYTFGFSYYDGCISMECDPFDINALKRGARRFANDLKLDLHLCVGDVGDLNLRIVSRSLTAQELVAVRFPGEHFTSPSFTPLNDWKTQLTVACRDWLLNHPQRNVAEKWSSEFGLDDELAESLIARIESVGSVHATSRVYFGDGKWHSSMVLEYGDWTGILDLPGVPSPLLG